jgi:carboxymethylenebutenolidase
MAAATPSSPPDPGPLRGEWVSLSPLRPEQVELRCWWSLPPERPARSAVLVLPEVFGVNAWVRGVASRLAEAGHAALAVPLFSRTAPDLELGYGDQDLAEGRCHKERTSTADLLADLGLAADWLQRQLPGLPLGCVGFCFGGHAAWLAATLPAVDVTCSFYGAGVARGRPGGGAPTLAMLPSIRGTMLCVCGSDDPLVPPEDVAAVADALEAANRARGASGEVTPPHRLLVLEGGHGFMCEARRDYRPGAAAEGWHAMLDLFARRD